MMPCRKTRRIIFINFRRFFTNSIWIFPRRCFIIFWSIISRIIYKNADGWNSRDLHHGSWSWLVDWCRRPRLDGFDWPQSFTKTSILRSSRRSWRLDASTNDRSDFWKYSWLYFQDIWWFGVFGGLTLGFQKNWNFGQKENCRICTYVFAPTG